MTVMSHRDVGNSALSVCAPGFHHCCPFQTYSSDTTLTWETPARLMWFPKCHLLLVRHPDCLLQTYRPWPTPFPLPEKLSHRAGTIEQHIAHEIAHHSTPFAATLSRWRCASFTLSLTTLTILAPSNSPTAAAVRFITFVQDLRKKAKVWGPMIGLCVSGEKTLE